jgi:hypothetical protein
VLAAVQNNNSQAAAERWRIPPLYLVSALLMLLLLLPLLPL